jgi:undecaprenyl-diphosphatase
MVVENARVRRQRDARLASVGLVALGGFAWLSSIFRSKRVQHLDRRAMRRIRMIRAEPFDTLVRDVSALGGVPLIAMAHLGAAYTLRWSRPALLQLAFGSLGGAAADVGLKYYFARPRPTGIRPLAYVTSWSYPSGHSLAAASVYLTLAFAATRNEPTARRWAAIAVATSVASAVAASRVYLGVHHPSDVIAGLSLGTAWACLLEAVFSPPDQGS